MHIRNNKVHDTYRSAIALEAVDGATIENIEVDSLLGTNVGNGIFLRLGAPNDSRKGRLGNISIQNVSIEIREEKTPRIVAPAIIIAGLPDQQINDVRLKNIRVKFPGSAGAELSRISLRNLNDVPEKANAYPEFSMFGELPSWGVYVRHANSVQFTGLSLSSLTKDFRTAIVLDDVHRSGVKKLTVKEPEHKKTFIQMKLLI